MFFDITFRVHNAAYQLQPHRYKAQFEFDIIYKQKIKPVKLCFSKLPKNPP